MPFQHLPIWKEAPFLRLILPLIPGIAVQWYAGIPAYIDWSIFLVALGSLLLFQLGSPFLRFRFYWINGLLLNILIASLGLLLTSYHNHSKQEGFTRLYKNGNLITARLEEPLTEKPGSFKAEASIQSTISPGKPAEAKGDIILYFKKDDSLRHLSYGSLILFSKPLSPIKNTGNPGAFDYEQYCAFQNIHGQVYLKTGEFIILPGKQQNPVKKALLAAREKLTGILRHFLKGDKETGLAEALLIGYKDDLDKTLLQSYANTGVVHIIAISGLHLALIYGLLQLILKPLSARRTGIWLKPVLLITSLWLFSFLSGASPSVLRSALMFTCIIIGKSFSKQSSIYNTLPASAFLLLCYNPFWLWDAGFQLSYAAVLSIVVFMKPIYHWFFIRNKLLDWIWKATALTLSAQILTAPIGIYHFHQFPNYFLFANLLAVPLSSLILLGELLLCSIAFIPALAKGLGIALSWLISLLNGFIEHMESLPFSVWNDLQIDLLQFALLYVIIATTGCWLFKKQSTFLFAGLAALLSFAILHGFYSWKASRQSLLLAYNIPGHQAIDFINGKNYVCKSDNGLYEKPSLQNGYLRPARIFYRTEPAASTDLLLANDLLIQFNSRRIITIDRPIAFKPPPSKIHVDLIIISKNPRISLPGLASVFDCPQWVFDASNSARNIREWEKACRQLGLTCYNMVDKGAFVMNMD